jgi:hypothetical protein
MQPQLQREIRELSLQASEGSLSDKDRARINLLIEADDEACRLWLEYSMLEADLVFHARSEAAEDRAAGVARTASTAAAPPASLTLTPATPMNAGVL